MKLTDKVKTIHGTGIIIGKDMPESRTWRWIVKITKPNEKLDKLIFPDFKLCYFEKELILEGEIK